MIEDSKIVKKIEPKSGAKAGTYWTITWDDGKFDNIFNGEWLPLLEQSQEEGMPVHFTKEKSGKYFNIKTLELEEPAPKSAEHPSQPKEISPQEKGMFWKEVGENFRAGLFNKDDNGAGSYLWRTYIKQMFASLEITIPKQGGIHEEGTLVEEIKKRGATEIKKGDTTE